MAQYSPKLKAAGLHLMDIKVKVKVSLEQTMKALKRSRFIAVLVL
jgi:hypothetical protein